MSTDLRTLAQAAMALDKDSAAFDLALWDIQQDYGIELGGVEGLEAFLAALDAADAQGYARAMGDVVERADHSADYTGWSDYALGHRDAHERLAVWARERLPAAAERD